MIEDIKPDYLYNPQLCPCPRGEKSGCPRFRNCEACMEFHHRNSRTPMTCCEKKAIAESEARYEDRVGGSD